LKTIEIMKPISSQPLSRRQYVEQARDLVNYFDGLVKGKDDKARIVGVSGKSSPGSPKRIYARAEKARDWTLLPHRRKEQNERASSDIREKLASARSNPVLKAIPDVQNAINIMEKQLDQFAEIHVGHLKSAVRIFSSEANQASEVADRMVREDMAQLLKEDKPQTPEQASPLHPSAVNSRKGTTLEKVDVFFDRPGGRPSIADEFNARTATANERVRAAEMAAESGSTPGRAADPFLSGVHELSEVGKVAQELTRLKQVARRSEDVKDKNAVLAYEKSARVREALVFDKKIGESLAKHGIPDGGSQNSSFVGVQIAQTLSRFGLFTHDFLDRKPTDIEGVHSTAAQQLEHVGRDFKKWLAAVTDTLSITV
jgi:hypothetical protein